MSWRGDSRAIRSSYPDRLTASYLSRGENVDFHERVARDRLRPNDHADGITSRFEAVFFDIGGTLVGPNLTLLGAWLRTAGIDCDDERVSLVEPFARRAHALRREAVVGPRHPRPLPGGSDSPHLGRPAGRPGLLQSAVDRILATALAAGRRGAGVEPGAARRAGRPGGAAGPGASPGRRLQLGWIRGGGARGDRPARLVRGRHRLAPRGVLEAGPAALRRRAGRGRRAGMERGARRRPVRSRHPGRPRRRHRGHPDRRLRFWPEALCPSVDSFDAAIAILTDEPC